GADGTRSDRLSSEKPAVSALSRRAGLPGFGGRHGGAVAGEIAPRGPGRPGRHAADHPQERPDSAASTRAGRAPHGRLLGVAHAGGITARTNRSPAWSISPHDHAPPLYVWGCRSFGFGRAAAVRLA